MAPRAQASNCSQDERLDKCHSARGGDGPCCPTYRAGQSGKPALVCWDFNYILSRSAFSSSTGREVGRWALTSGAGGGPEGLALRGAVHSSELLCSEPRGPSRGAVLSRNKARRLQFSAFSLLRVEGKEGSPKPPVFLEYKKKKKKKAQYLGPARLVSVFEAVFPQNAPSAGIAAAPFADALRSRSARVRCPRRAARSRRDARPGGNSATWRPRPAHTVAALPGRGVRLLRVGDGSGRAGLSLCETQGSSSAWRPGRGLGCGCGFSWRWTSALGAARHPAPQGLSGKWQVVLHEAGAADGHRLAAGC